jgi:uncharacterized paraquat-inducible protein A
MPFTVTCPSCSFAATVPDTASGRGVRCPKCHKAFRVPEPGNGRRPAAATPVAPPPPPRAAALEPLEDAEAVEGDAAVGVPPPPPDDYANDDDAADRRLSRCPHCDQRISRNARGCPHCGAPLKATVIEQTGKRWKALQLGGGLLLLVAIGVGAPMLMGHGSLASLVVSILTCVAGLTVYAVGRVGAWWFHG